MPQAIEGTVIPTNTAPTTVCGGGSQPSNEPMLATEAPSVAQKLSADVRSSLSEMYTWYKLAHDEKNIIGEKCSNTQDVGSEFQERLGEVGSTMAGAGSASHSQPPRWDDPLVWVSSEDDPKNWHVQVGK
ncbi:hypothetical protein RJT34_16082 [Clitoria ternatea]|uniref:Uncharacterized protein n=1 Tax=Clitoria ternatea TaxID=43366 RepID=A0AAN9J7Q3_CLITE